MPVPEIAVSGVFPIVSEFPHGRAQAPQVVLHRFGSANAKIEQRLLLGTGAKRFTVRQSHLGEPERKSLRHFWEQQYGSYGAFYYDAPNDDGNARLATSAVSRRSRWPGRWCRTSSARWV